MYEVMCEANIKYKNINNLELARYLALILGQDEIVKYGMEDLVMKRHTNLGRKPKVTGREMEDWWKEDESIWLRPNREPTAEEIKKMIALAVSIDVKNVMRSHLFRFGDKFFNQNEGGSIGSELTGEGATSRMIMFLRKLENVCQDIKLKIFMDAAYIDDVTVLMRIPGNGLRWRNGELFQDSEAEELDCNIEKDVVAANLVVSIANSLPNESDIQITFDTPSMNSEGKLPVLDLHMWVENCLHTMRNQ